MRAIKLKTNHNSLIVSRETIRNRDCGFEIVSRETILQAAEAGETILAKRALSLHVLLTILL